MAEGIYWALTSILDTQSYPQRIEDISNEWTLPNANSIKEASPDLYQLLTDKETYPWLPLEKLTGTYNGNIPPITSIDRNDSESEEEKTESPSTKSPQNTETHKTTQSISTLEPEENDTSHLMLLMIYIIALYIL